MRVIEEGRCEVDEADEIVDGARGFEIASGPHDGEGHVVGGGVRVSFAAWERHAVVGGDDDEGIFEEAASLEGIEHFAEVGVEVFGFERVVEDVVANGFVVWPEAWDAWDVGEFFPTLCDAGAVFVATVRFESAVPEAPGFVGGCGV